MSEKQAPCLPENCSWCCNPVKVGPRSKHTPSELNIPADKDGNPLWKKRDEVLLPEKDSETHIVDVYDCKNFNEETGLCGDYENRPGICRNTSCIKSGSDLSAREQKDAFTAEKLIRIKK